MQKTESKTGQTKRHSKDIFDYLSDFRNLDSLVPEDQIHHWESSEDQCSFQLSGLGSTGMQIADKKPNDYIKITTREGSTLNALIWIEMNEVEEELTNIRLTAEVNMNPFMNAMIAKYLKQGLDAAVDKLTEFFNEHKDL